MPDNDPLLTAKEAHQEFGIWRSTLDRRVKDGTLEVAAGRPHNRFNPSKFRRSDLEQLARTRQRNRSDPDLDRRVVAAVEPFGLRASTVYSILRRHEARSNNGS